MRPKFKNVCLIIMPDVTKTIMFQDCKNFIEKAVHREAEVILGLITDGINSVKVQTATNLELYSKERQLPPNAERTAAGELNYQDSVFIITGSEAEVDRLIELIKTYQGGGFIKRKKKSKKKKKKKSKSKKKKSKSKKKN
jgi:hypothetical protein